MNTSIPAGCVLFLVTMFTAGTATASPKSPASAESAIASCHAGRVHANAPTQGSTPDELEGAHIVSAGEANCLMSKLGKDLTVIAALDDERKLPGAVSMKWAAAPGSAVTTRLKETLALMGKGKPGDPLLLYCHHASCSYSYHAAKHAVDAGYRNVFWFRDGMRGWETDGYAFAGEEGKDVAARFTRRIAACNRGLKSNQEMIAIMAAYEPGEFEAAYKPELKSQRELVRNCLRAVDADFGADKARKAEVAREISRADSILEKSLPNARAALEGDARIYLTPLFDNIPLDKLEEYVNRARSWKSVDASCAPPSYELPRTSAQASSARATLEAYSTCMNKLKESLVQPYSSDALDGVINLVAFAEPYVCGKSRSQNCLPESTWRKVAAAVSADKVREVSRGAGQRMEMLQEMLVAQTRLSNFLPTFLQMESLLDAQEAGRQANSEEDEEEEEEEETPRRSYNSGYQYTPPPAPQPAYRPQSDVSARGIR